MVWRASAISPMSGVRIAPPTMAITINDPPIFVLAQSLQTESEDRREHERHEELVANNAHRPAQLGRKIAKLTSATFTIAYEPSSLVGATKRISQAEITVQYRTQQECQ